MAKSAAQIRRMQKRAKERGKNYEYIAPEKKANENNSNGITELDARKGKAAENLQEEFKRLETNKDGLNSKEKRAAKRKAEAIAVEEANGGMHNDDTIAAADAATSSSENEKVKNAVELLNWYENNEKRISSYLKKEKRKLDSRDDKESKAKLEAFNKYKTTMSEIETNEELNAKDRRSAKRKAEAIACEESHFSSINKLMEWYEANPDFIRQSKKMRKGNSEDSEKITKKNPYILFIGQIPYTTTEKDIFQHFEKYVGKKEITKETMRIRIPQDKEKTEKMKQKNENKSKAKEIVEEIDDFGAEDLYDYEVVQAKETKNQIMGRGFAFAEFQDPELMYECLKLHHTNLNGRRINVSRAAGGGKEARKEKHKQRRQEQDDYISSTVDKIIKDYIDQGGLQEGELDEGAILLCKRRSTAIVESALNEYIEQRQDRDLENPSSFFTRIICDITEEGEAGTHSYTEKKKKENNYDSFRKSKTSSTEIKSKFEKEGVDMSLSHSIKNGANDMSKIFPSMSRGRGRGRGSILA